MKAYKIEVLVIDHEDMVACAIMDTIENANYPNDCISPKVRGVEMREIGEWYDDHPLNNRTECYAEYRRLFGK